MRKIRKEKHLPLTFIYWHSKENLLASMDVVPKLTIPEIAENHGVSDSTAYKQAIKHCKRIYEGGNFFYFMTPEVIAIFAKRWSGKKKPISGLAPVTFLEENPGGSIGSITLTIDQMAIKFNMSRQLVQNIARGIGLLRGTRDGVSVYTIDTLADRMAFENPAARLARERKPGEWTAKEIMTEYSISDYMARKVLDGLAFRQYETTIFYEVTKDAHLILAAYAQKSSKRHSRSRRPKLSLDHLAGSSTPELSIEEDGKAFPASVDETLLEGDSPLTLFDAAVEVVCNLGSVMEGSIIDDEKLREEASYLVKTVVKNPWEFTEYFLPEDIVDKNSICVGDDMALIEKLAVLYTDLYEGGRKSEEQAIVEAHFFYSFGERERMPTKRKLADQLSPSSSSEELSITYFRNKIKAIWGKVDGKGKMIHKSLFGMVARLVKRQFTGEDSDLWSRAACVCKLYYSHLEKIGGIPFEPAPLAIISSIRRIILATSDADLTA